MKKYYLLILPLFLCFYATAQDVHVILGKCSRNAVSGHKSYNLGNLKYYANRSKNAIDQLVANTDFITCDAAYDLSKSITIHLESALLTEDFATAKAHLIKVEETSVEIFNAYNLCSLNNGSEVSEDSNTNDLSKLEEQQDALKQQQEVLEKKEQELKQQLIKQNKKKAQLEKLEFVKRNKATVLASISSYNSLLKSCNCSGKINEPNEMIDIAEKNIDALKILYLNKSIRLARNYIKLLEECQ
ncbi:hypothetical protein DFQ05_2035 [Winogradskyella wandonensis]|uniref:DUF4398 domain-containing protein n=1 Tax=Winogradskyella wandonensis TaxID=1442586 RepID=A0A4V2PTJ8_9FLAO|nr:hypothetical protein [Winogradskyella wandonensis]TCK66761.1 hypothetical protein DFQ05_2035 [Winogradskyella wandonensis]